MKKQVLLTAIDFSDVSYQVVSQARILAVALDLEPFFIHVSSAEHTHTGVAAPFLSVLASEYAKDFDCDSIEKSLAQKMEQLLSANGITPKQNSYKILFGNPVMNIIEYQKILDAKMIVIGSHFTSALQRFFFGAHAEELVHRSEVPIFIVRENTKIRYDKIGYACDLTSNSVEALNLAESLHKNLDSKLSILHGISPSSTLLKDSLAPEHAPSSLDEVISLAEEQSSQFFEEMKLKNTAIEFDYKNLIAKDSNIGRAIVEEVEKADLDLVILGTHDRKGIKRMLFGSVADYLLEHCPTPLLIAK